MLFFVGIRISCVFLLPDSQMGKLRPFFLSDVFAPFLEAARSRKPIGKQKVEIRNISDRSFSCFFLGSRERIFSVLLRCSYFVLRIGVGRSLSFVAIIKGLGTVRFLRNKIMARRPCKKKGNFPGRLSIGELLFVFRRKVGIGARSACLGFFSDAAAVFLLAAGAVAFFKCLLAAGH